MTQTSALIDPARLPHTALRTGELYLKRQVFRIEHAAVLALQALYKQAFSDIRGYLLDSAEAGGTWRPNVESYAAGRVARLKNDVLTLVERSARAALVGGYYGRLWLIDMATPADMRVNLPPLMPDMLREDIYDQMIRALLGKEWRAQYELELDDLVLGIRRAIGTGLVNGEGMDAIARRVRDAMGITTDRRRGAFGSTTRAGYKANFNRVQAITRTLVQQTANAGALSAYKANADILKGWTWLCAHDERTCPQCLAMDGKFFTFKSRMMPPLHPMCRCTMIPEIRADALEHADAPMRQTMSQWAQHFGMERVLADFLVPKS